MLCMFSVLYRCMCACVHVFIYCVCLLYMYALSVYVHLSAGCVFLWVCTCCFLCMCILYVYGRIQYVHMLLCGCIVYVTCWHSRRRSIWRCHQKPYRSPLSGELWQKTIEEWMLSVKIMHFVFPLPEAFLVAIWGRRLCNTYMSCVVWPSGCVRAAPPVHQATVLTVSCPCPLCCEPGTPADVNMWLQLQGQKENMYSEKLNQVCTQTHTVCNTTNINLIFSDILHHICINHRLSNSKTTQVQPIWVLNADIFRTHGFL